MSYMWKEFNIKTFDSETIVYRNGVFCPELSTLGNTNINKTLLKPIHIIYIGEIAGKNDLCIDLSAENQPVFLTVKIKNKKPAFLNIFIKNTGKKSDLTAKVILQNYSKLEFNFIGQHLGPDTKIILDTKLLGHQDSESKLYGIAKIEKNCKNTISEMNFSAMLHENAILEFKPCQNIQSVPDNAEHSASVYRGNANQIEFLHESGLSGSEVKNVLERAFLGDI